MAQRQRERGGDFPRQIRTSHLLAPFQVVARRGGLWELMAGYGRRFRQGGDTHQGHGQKQENARKCKKKCECLIDFWAASGAAIAPPSRPSARRARHRGCPTAPRGPACRSQGRRPPTCPVREAPTAAEKVPRPKMCPPVRTFPRIQPGAPDPPGAQAGPRRRALGRHFLQGCEIRGPPPMAPSFRLLGQLQLAKKPKNPKRQEIL